MSSGSATKEGWTGMAAKVGRARLEGGRAYLGCAAPEGNPHIGYDEPEELAAWGDGFYAKELETAKSRRAQLLDDLGRVNARIAELEAS